ncbi:hypothetical protein F4680DRAFT_467355 [Xylaria scruposa]|nr:hypothetical protein F4680DRAFT_467355 [Xylaria scruposa]
MAQPYICHPNNIWSGKIGDVYIKWNLPAKKKLARYAKNQGEDRSVLKGASEHLVYQLACRIECGRAVIKSPPHEVIVSGAYLTTGPKLCMSASLSSNRKKDQQTRIYLDSKSAPKRYDKLEVVGEAISRPFGPSQGLALNLDYSWGVGVLTWTGPTVKGGRPSVYLDSQSGMVTPQASAPVPEDAPPTFTPHRMDPRAVEFRPAQEYNIQPQTWHNQGSNVGGFNNAFVHGNPSNIHFDRSPAYPEMLPPVGGNYHTRVDPYVPLVQPMAPPPWAPYPQAQRWYNFNTQRWEWVGFPPPVFGYA